MALVIFLYVVFCVALLLWGFVYFTALKLNVKHNIIDDGRKQFRDTFRNEPRQTVGCEVKFRFQ